MVVRRGGGEYSGDWEDLHYVHHENHYLIMHTNIEFSTAYYRL